jgi:hypothetical protein
VVNILRRENSKQGEEERRRKKGRQKQKETETKSKKRRNKLETVLTIKKIKRKAIKKWKNSL